MKSLKWLSISFIILSFIFAGCFGKDDDNDPLLPGDGDGNFVAGFASMKVGSWEELRSPDGGIDRYEYIGVDTYKGTECYILEFDSVYQGERSITQLWISKASGQGVLMLMKDNKGKVTKLDIPPSYDIPDSTGGDVPITATNLGKKKYTTPTGKTVDAVAYKITTPFGEVETWSSSQVPFGEVKSIMNGEIMSELYDFGFSGAVRDISKQEAENAQPFGFGDINIGGGDIDDGGGDIDDGGNGGGDDFQIGDIIITVGAGGRPDIKVSKPIISLMVGGEDFIWGFNFDDDHSSAGPFKYGLIPNNAQVFGSANPPDLVAGSIYTIQVQGFGNSMGMFIFTR